MVSHSARILASNGRRLLDLLDALLKLQELAHEVEVGGDDGASTLDELVSVPGGHREVLDEVSDGDGGRPGDSGLDHHHYHHYYHHHDHHLAVDQDGALAVPRQVDEGEGLVKILLDVL